MKSRKVSKMNKVITAWETLAPTATFGGMTLDQFKAKVQPVFDQQDKLSGLDSEFTDTRTQQEIAAQEGNASALLVVNGVKGDPAFGEDSALYAAMGYVRKSARKSGLTRKAQPQANTVPLAKAA